MLNVLRQIYSTIKFMSYEKALLYFAASKIFSQRKKMLKVVKNCNF